MMTADEMCKKLVYTFGATDGGVNLCHFRGALNEIEEDAKGGDVASKELFFLTCRFCRLVELTTDFSLNLKQNIIT